MKLKTIFILFFCVFLLQCGLFKPSAKKMYRTSLKKHSQYDAVIVPGIPFNEPYWDRVMLMRVIWAVHLYKRGITKNIIMSGSSVYTPYVEAKIMKLYANALGVPEEHVFTEEKAEHSTENIWYGYKMALTMGYTNIALASDPFQTKLLYRFGKKRIGNIGFLPVLFDTLRGLSHDTPVINFQPHKIPNFVALPDRESKWERLRGTWGKHIDFSK